MSNRLPKDLAKIILDTHNWNNKNTIEEFEPWELRESLSYVMDLDLFLDDREIDTVEDQVHQTIAGIPTVEFENYILTQALIQQRLRQHGIEIKCFGLNEFPKTSDQLIPLLDKSKKSKVTTQYFKSKRWIKNNLLVMMAVTTVVYNVFFFDLALLTTGIIVGYILHFVLQILEHDWWMHQYIVPKNIYLERFLKNILYFSLGNIEVQRASHMHHHHYWNTKKDYLNTMILSNKYGHLFGTTSDAVTADYTLYQRVLQKGNRKLEKENKFSKFASKNQKLLLASVCLACLILFGLPIMINICFIAILWHKVWGAMPDVAFYIAKRQDNFPWLWPIMLRDGWHKFHHIKYKITDYEKIEDLFPGPNWLKYINFEYYLMKCFFRINR